MNEPTRQPPEDPASDKPDAPTDVRQVQGALGSSQGSAGAREADPVMQPTGEHAEPPEAGRGPGWVSDKPPREPAPREGGGRDGQR